MRTVNSVAFQSPQFSVLSESQMRDLHLAALEVLRHTGIRFFHQGAVDLLKVAGAYVSDGNLIKFPARMVEDAIAARIDEEHMATLATFLQAMGDVLPCSKVMAALRSGADTEAVDIAS